MRSITKLVLRRPVTTFLAVLCLIFFGFMSILNSKLELMPDMNLPLILITTSYPGASPTDVDKLLSKPIEEKVAALSDVKRYTSTSAENLSMVVVRYNYGTNMDKAYDQLKKKIDELKPSLPKDAKEPSYVEMNITDSSSMDLAVENNAQENMYNYVKNTISPQFEKLSSVASVDLSGGRKQYVQIRLSPEKLEQYHLDLSKLSDIIKNADFSYPAGETGVGSQDLSVTTTEDFDTVESLKELPIITGTGDSIYLKDLATVRTALEKRSSIGRYNGSDTVMLGLKKTQSESAVTLSRGAKKLIAELEKEDPNLKISVINDAADSIRDSLSSVFQTMLMAVAISMAIILLFFGDWKASLIVGTSIPIAILGALIFMWAMGYSMNMITLSALVLGVGMMVDNSIVVLEACFRSIDKIGDSGDEARRQAAIRSVETVGGSVFGSTLTTCVVFLPLGFMKGISGQFFEPLGFTIVFCMLSSLISALTIVPLCYSIYRPKENEKAPAYRGIRALQEGYRNVIGRLLKHKPLVVITTILLLVLSIFLATKVKTELMPQTDEGIVSISITTKPGLRIEELDKILKKAEALAASDSDTERYMVRSSSDARSLLFGESGSSVTAYLKKKRSVSTKKKAELWQKKLSDMTDASIRVKSSSSMSYMSSEQPNYEAILSGTDYDKLKEISDRLVPELRQREDLTAVHSSMENAAPILKVRLDPIRSAAEGLSPILAAQNLNLLLSGTEAMTMKVDGEDASVMLEYPKEDYDSLEKLKNIMLKTARGSSVKLQNIADISFSDSPASIYRVDRKYQLTITADYTDKATKNTKKQLDEDVLSKYLDHDVSKTSSVSTQSMNEEFGALGLAISIAVFLVFIVMAAQFESMRYSIMVMTTIPFSLIGSFGFLWLFNATLSMNSLLGFLMLVGTVVNNGILYVDTVNQYRGEMPFKDSLVEAGATRLRPILMTTLTTVLSMLPMAAAFGRNGEVMQGLALVDVGGLSASTILALLLLPVYYHLLSRKKERQPS